MGVKGDVILLAGVIEGTESPNKVVKRAKLRFTAGLDLLTLKQENVTPEHKTKQRKRSEPLRPVWTY